MSSVGRDIAEVFNDVGAKVFINETPVFDFIDSDLNTQVSNPFIREHMIEATLPYDTIIQPGDIINFEATQQRFLVVNYIPDVFENEVAAISTTIYKCNVYGYFYREKEIAADDNTPMNLRYKRQVCWELVDQNYLVFTSALRGNTSEMLGTQDFGDIVVKRHIVYLPSSMNIKTKDRLYIDDTEYYQVGNVEKRRFNNVMVISLHEDTRHVNYCSGEGGSS
jgi:hypothetical protein